MCSQKTVGKKLRLSFQKVSLEEIRNKLGLQGSMMVSFVMKSKIPGSYLVDRFGHNQGREKYEVESPDPKSWESKRIFAFIVYFLGMVVFPNGAEEVIYSRLIAVVDALCNGINKGPCTIVPIIVADIYRALGFCKNGAKYFERCNLLLQLWLIEHLQKIRGVQSMCRSIETDNIAVQDFRVTMGV